MKIRVFLLQLVFLILITNVAADNVLITQVLYNPVDESGGEAVELYNPTDSPADISGWILATETSPTDVTIPANTIIGSGGYFLIADVGWSSSRDDSSWPEADYEEIMTLTNTDAGLALSNGTDFIDAVGWGDALNIGNGLYESNPHAGGSEGESLIRIKNGSSYVDTGDNSNDFIAATPDFHNSSFGISSFSGSEISVVAIVGGTAPVIDSFEIMTDDDTLTDGTQINPIPKQNKTIQFESVISHANGIDYINSAVLSVGSSSINLTKQSDVNETTSLYTANFSMAYYEAAGNYTTILTVTDNSGFSVNETLNFEYTSLIAMELDTNSLQFAAMPGMESELIGDTDESSSNLTLQNIGNSMLDIELFGTNLTGSADFIDVSNIQFTFNGDYNNNLAGILSYVKQTKQIGLAAASKQPLSFKLNVPTATAPGNYTGTITLLAVSS